MTLIDVVVVIREPITTAGIMRLLNWLMSK
jgi:hypothetical protein